MIDCDMRTFTSDSGEDWVATAHEEETPRHHGRWYLVFHPADEPETNMAMPEVRWQSRHTAERTIRTLAESELRRRLQTVLGRAGEPTPAEWRKPARIRKGHGAPGEPGAG